MALVFNRDLDAQPGRVDTIAPGVRRVLAPNPGPFTYLGTGTYIVGNGTVAVIDPGPDNPEHIAALLDALQGETVTHIVCTHTHSDHSPASRELQRATGALIVGCGPHPVGDTVMQASPVAADASSESDNEAQHKDPHHEEHFDAQHLPDRQLFDGDTISGPGWTLEAVETPGHLANHLCFAFPEQSILFSGDHVMGWSTTVVSPPGGSLDDYLASLAKVAARTEATYWPTHGPAITDPQTFVSGLVEHRNQRTQQVIAALTSAPLTIPQLVASMYVGLDERLVKAAGRSVLAHLVSLQQSGVVTREPAAQPGEDLGNDDVVWVIRPSTE